MNRHPFEEAPPSRYISIHQSATIAYVLKIPAYVEMKNWPARVALYVGQTGHHGPNYAASASDAKALRRQP